MLPSALALWVLPLAFCPCLKRKEGNTWLHRDRFCCGNILPLLFSVLNRQTVLPQGCIRILKYLLTNSFPLQQEFLPFFQMGRNVVWCTMLYLAWSAGVFSIVRQKLQAPVIDGLSSPLTSPLTWSSFVASWTVRNMARRDPTVVVPWASLSSLDAGHETCNSWAAVKYFCGSTRCTSGRQ